MEWEQVFTILAGVIGTLYWARTEANSDRRQLQATIDANRLSAQASQELSTQQTNALIQGIRDDIREFHEAIRDFHGRLIAIESGKK